MGESAQSPFWKEALIYRCRFCRKKLLRVPASLFWCCMWLLGIRRYYCPHCFEMSLRPGGWLKLLLLPFRQIAGLLRSL